MFYIFITLFKYYFLILFNSYFILSLYLLLTVIFVPTTVIFSNLINSNSNIFKQSSKFNCHILASLDLELTRLTFA